LLSGDPSNLKPKEVAMTPAVAASHGAVFDKLFLELGRFRDDPFVVLQTTGASCIATQPQAFNRRRLMTYVDGFVAAVPTANRDAYLKHARTAAAVFKEHGALAVVECWGNDVPEGELTSFSKALKRKADETVVFAWITWASRGARDAGMKKAGEDARLRNIEMPFDGERAILGGFDVILEA
jgi:uncharacterized protein YbaA (DUF1428 family)